MTPLSSLGRFRPILLGLAGFALTCAAMAQAGVAAGDIVQTTLNGQLLVGEVIRARGATADLSFGQNQVASFLDVQYLQVLQHAGARTASSFRTGDLVRVPYHAGTTLTGRIFKINGAYCEIDSSQSGFTGWSKCSELTSPDGSKPGAVAGQGDTAVATAANPPKAGFVSCMGRIEGRYGTSGGMGGFSIVFHSGKATLRGPLSDDEEADCWTNGHQILLHNSHEASDLPVDINDDGTLDTPFGELKKKGS
jgi:hypothetical protein